MIYAGLYACANAEREGVKIILYAGEIKKPYTAKWNFFSGGLGPIGSG